MRLTKLQKRIFEAHYEAWQKGEFTLTQLPTIPQIKKALISGETIQQLWNAAYGAMSITSQLIASDDVFRVMTGKGLLDIRNRFKHYLNKFGIR